MFIDQLRAEARQGISYDWHAEDALLVKHKKMSGKVFPPILVGALFQELYLQRLAQAKVLTPSVEAFREAQRLAAQPKSFPAPRSLWIEFPASVSAWHGCLLFTVQAGELFFDQPLDRAELVMLMFQGETTFNYMELTVHDGVIRPNKVELSSPSDLAVVLGKSRSEVLELADERLATLNLVSHLISGGG